MEFWIQTSNFVLLVINEIIKGEIEKPSGQFLDLIVINYDLVRFKFESGTVHLVYLYYLSLFVWRIMFLCLVVCRWHVWHGGQRRGSLQE
jgi:hypothetical protein